MDILSTATPQSLFFEEYYKDPILYKAYTESRWKYYGIPDQQNDWIFFGDLLFQYSQGKSKDVSVLDLGCGYGRILRPLRQLGFFVDGVDQVPSMSQYANNTVSGKGACTSANICCDELFGPYDVMIASFDLVNHLQVGEIQAALTNCRKYLKREGLLIIDAINPTPSLMTAVCAEYQKPVLDSIFINPCTKCRNIVLQKRRYDYCTQRLTLEKNFLTEDREESKAVNLSFHIYFPDELTAYVKRSGYEVEKFYGDFGGEELSSYSQKMLLVCKKS
ncbi:MAG: class I SAM-dependent methyltransferase [Cyanobacteria bacterium P01_G01_bin.38]